MQYNIDAKTLDSLIAIYIAHSLPRGVRNGDAAEKAKAFAWAVADAFQIPTPTVKEALRLFAQRAPAPAC